MGDDPSLKRVPINEAVYFLDNVESGQLNEFKEKFPELTPELKPGIVAGSSDGSERTDSSFMAKKAEIMATALSNAATAAAVAARKAGSRIAWIRRVQTGSEILVLIGSSSILGTINLTNNTPVTVAAIATFVAGCGSLFVEQTSRILNPKLGNIYDAFQNLHIISRESDFLAKEINLAVEFGRSDQELSKQISRGNEMMSRVNKWDPQIFVA